MKRLPLMLLLAALCGCATHSPTPQSIAPPPTPVAAETLATFEPGPGEHTPPAAPVPAGIAFQGGDGSSIEKAIVISGARNEDEGVASEYSWLSKNYPGYKFRRQALLQANGKSYDRLDFATAQDEAKSVYFDISAFFGKLFLR